MLPVKNLFTFLLLFNVALVAAQRPAKPVTIKWKPPVVNTWLGTNKDTVLLEVEEAVQLVSVPLTITDIKKAVYPIVSYQCLYRRKGVTESEETGKTSPITSIVAQTFSTTPLSKIWIKTISDQLKSGEEIFFFDVVSKDAQGKFFFAPSLLIKVK